MKFKIRKANEHYDVPVPGYDIRQKHAAPRLKTAACKEVPDVKDGFYINSSRADSPVNCLKTSDVSETHSASILRESELLP
jgi:hypothetical protein